MTAEGAKADPFMDSASLTSGDGVSGAGTPDQGAAAAVAEVAETSHLDPLVACIEYLSRHFGRPQTATALVAGIPLVDGYLPENQLERAAARADLVIEHDRMPLKQIKPLHLPAILLLKNGGACVLRGKDADPGEKPKFVEVFVPGEADEVQTRRYRELSRAYTGKIVYVKPTYQTSGEEVEAYKGKPSTNWFWSAFKPSTWIYGQVIAATMVINLFALAMPLFIMNVYDRVVPNNAVDTLWALAIGVGIAALFDFILRGARGYFVDVAGRRADVVLANRVYDRVLGAKVSHRAKSSGVQANTLREYESLRDFFNSATLATFGDMPFILLFVFVIWLIAGPLALVPLITVPIVIIVSLITQIPLNRIVRQSFQHAAQKNAVLFETLNGLETVKSLGAEGWAADKWERSVAEHIRTGVKSRVISGISINLMMAAQMISTVTLVVIGVGLIAEGDITPGALIAAVILNGRALAPLGQVAQVLTRMYAARIAFGAIKRVMETPQERPEGGRFTYKPGYDGAIELKNVTFTYPDEKVPALQDVSLTVAPGERVGLIGPIGSGKSTILKLILHLYEPDGGAVLLDGIDTGQLDPAILRSNVAYMPQDAVLFQGTIRSNLTLHAPHATDDEIMAALKASGALVWLAHLPAGLDTPVGERGDGLSGGQRQSIALARSMIKAPPILLLDEPTSEMDGRNEQVFLHEISASAANRTVLLVTHRPALLNLVNRLVVMDGGKIIADGPRDVVLEKLKPTSPESAGTQSPAGDPGPATPARAVRRTDKTASGKTTSVKTAYGDASKLAAGSARTKSTETPAEENKPEDRKVRGRLGRGTTKPAAGGAKSAARTRDQKAD